jgi:hypothetical protein
LDPLAIIVLPWVAASLTAFESGLAAVTLPVVVDRGSAHLQVLKTGAKGTLVA